MNANLLDTLILSDTRRMRALKLPEPVTEKSKEAVTHKVILEAFVHARGLATRTGSVMKGERRDQFTKIRTWQFLDEKGDLLIEDVELATHK